MPIALEGTVPVSLKIDAHKPEAERPTFNCRYLPWPESMKVKRLLGSTKRDDIDEEKAAEIAVEALRITVESISNFPDGITIENVFTKLTETELWELAWESFTATQLSERDKKKSRSASPSTGVNSAENATANVNSNAPNAAESTPPAALDAVARAETPATPLVS